MEVQGQGGQPDQACGALGTGTATHSSVPAQRIPRTEEPTDHGVAQSWT